MHEIHEIDGAVSCGAGEDLPAPAGKGDVPVRQINHLAGQSEVAPPGIQIVLRGTPQLDQYPAAKAAFVRAAEFWESLLYPTVRIYVDVDYGPTRFGEPYVDQVLGSTSMVLYGVPYSSFRTRITQIFVGDSETQALPSPTVPTDIGAVDLMVVADAVLRMVGLRPSIANADDPAARIGFNSAFDFDFDPRDGLEASEYEFLDVAIHELGHVLGFTSQVGERERNFDPPALSPLDLHRFRPGVQSFGSDLRVLHSGGEHIYFTHGDETRLSTGRNDRFGGDRNQPSHWIDDEIYGLYVGIMDPTLRRGEHAALTTWDLTALNRMGYGISVGFNQAWISAVSPAIVEPRSEPMTLTIDGEHFEEDAALLWKGEPRPLTVLSSTRAAVALTPADLASESVVSLEVLNPGGIPSNAVYFSVSGTCPRCTRVVHR